MSSLTEQYGRLLWTASFAARAHHGQLRKDRETPYVSHVFRVCLIARHVFGVDDAGVLMAALLHDTLEDTRTDMDDLLELLGADHAETARWVAALTKDNRLPEDEREEAYREGLRQAPWQVKLCKLADGFDNLLDSGHLSPRGRERTLTRSQQYLSVLRDPEVPAEMAATYARAVQLVETLWGEVKEGKR